MLPTQITGRVASPASLTRVLLRRANTVLLPALGQEAGDDAVSEVGVILFEAELLGLGWALSPQVRQRASKLTPSELRSWGLPVIETLAEMVGAHATHLPLFRRFPDSIPTNTEKLWVERVLSYLFNHQELPCVLCGESDTQQVLDPCAHSVCSTCFDGREYSACPICHRRINLDSPWLVGIESETGNHSRTSADPDRVRVLVGIEPSDMQAVICAELAELVGRASALSEQEREDLGALLRAADPALRESWLPEIIPGRETRAIVLAHLLGLPRMSKEQAQLHDWALGQVNTAEDVLRLAVVASGGDPGLVARPRLATLSRPSRRVLMDMLAGCEAGELAASMRRRSRAWRALGEKLHAGEWAATHPSVAAAFLSLRGGKVSEQNEAAGITAAVESAGPSGSALRIEADQIRVHTHAGAVEDALVENDMPAALSLLAGRSGALVRRLDHLGRIAEVEERAALVGELTRSASGASVASILSAWGELRGASERGTQRVVFPKGASARAHVLPETRTNLDASLAESLSRTLALELVERASGLAPINTALIDTNMDTIPVPWAERSVSKALVSLPRGSKIALPEGRRIRLFLHWMEDQERVDLDLAVQMHDAAWSPMGSCDYMRLIWNGSDNDSGGEHGAIHSGDLTSAPAPAGASEFVDLDLDALRAAGVVHAVAVVYSYNNVAFTDMAEAFAGVMALDSTEYGTPGERGASFSPRSVEQRFDCSGPGKSTIPLMINLVDNTMTWLDVSAHLTGTNHSGYRHASATAAIGSSMDEHLGRGGRISMGELARIHAAGRANRVVLLVEGVHAELVRGAGESHTSWYARLVSGEGSVRVEAPTSVEWAVLVRGGNYTCVERACLMPGTSGSAQVELTLAGVRNALESQ